MKNGMKRVAIVGTQGVPAHYGGFETLAENLIAQNDTERVEYTVFCSKCDLATRLTTYKGARLKYLSLPSNGMGSVFYDFVSMLWAIRGYDVILILGISGCLFIPVVKWLTSAKFIVNIDGLEHRRKKWNGFARWFLRLSERVAVQFADTIITDNKGIRDYVADTYRRESALIAYGGDHVLADVPEEEQAAFLARYGLDRNGYALTVCRIEPENNIDMILDAFVGSPNKIAIVGNWQIGTYSRGLMERYGRYDNIFLINAIYDEKKLYVLRNNARCYIHGHSAGGTNPSLVEAMFFGRPILVYDVIYNRETTFNRAEYFSDKEDLKLLMARVESMDGEVMQRVAIKRYTWQMIARQYEKLYL